jgi:hypothetical protein
MRRFFRGAIWDRNGFVSRISVVRMRVITAIAIAAGFGLAAAAALVLGTLANPSPGLKVGPTRPKIRPAGAVMGGRSEALRPVLGATIHLASAVVDLAAGDGALWVSGFGVVYRVDPASGRVVARIRTPGIAEDGSIALGGGSVWVTAGIGAGGVYRVDPLTGRVAASIHLGGSPMGIAVGAGRVWVTRPLQGPGQLLRIDPLTDRVAGPPVKVGPGPGQVIYGLHAVWVQNTSPSSVMRVGPATGRVATIGGADAVSASGFSVGAIATSYGSLWSASGDVLERLNPGTGAIAASIPIPRAQAVAVGSGEVWVLSAPRSNSPTLFYPVKGTAALWEIDPRTDRVVGKPLRLNTQQPIALAVAAGNVWVADSNKGTLTRVRLVPCPATRCT